MDLRKVSRRSVSDMVQKATSLSIQGGHTLGQWEYGAPLPDALYATTRCTRCKALATVNILPELEINYDRTAFHLPCLP